MPAVTVETYLAGKFGAPPVSVINQITDTVAVTPTLILKQNPTRLNVLIVNLSVFDIFIAPTEGVSITAGIFIPPSGGTVQFSADDDMILPTLSWYAISSGAGAKIYTIEQRLQG